MFKNRVIKVEKKVKNKLIELYGKSQYFTRIRL